MKKISLYIFIFPLILSAQNTDKTEKDFNQDGFLDTLESYYDGGSGSGGTFVTLTDGKTQTKYELNDYSCFCNTLNPQNYFQKDKESHCV